jgi:hypothetical protein
MSRTEASSSPELQDRAVARRDLLRAVAGIGSGIALGSEFAALAWASEEKEENAPPIHYVWGVDIKVEKRSEFRKKFSNLSRFNKGLPQGSSFEAVYETFIGKGNEPAFQIWFRVPSLSAFEAEATTEGIRKFHEELEEYLDSCLRPCNKFLRQIA